LRQSIAGFLEQRMGRSYNPDDILVSGGARPLIYAAYRTLLDSGDKVVYPVPSWNNNHYTHLSGAIGVPVQASAQNAFLPTPEDLEPHLADATLLALCSPLNPTGTAFEPDVLARIGDLVLAENERRGPGEKPLYLLYDQIYWNLTFGETVHADPVAMLPDLAPFTVFVDGLSKAFAATGVRLGWGFGPPRIMAKMRSILSHVGAWSPKAEQVAVGRYLADLETVNNDIQTLRTAIAKRLDGFYAGFQAMKADGLPVDAIAPKGAMYLTVRVDPRGMRTPAGDQLDDMQAVTRYLLESAHLAMVPFYAFGAPGDTPWYRLSVGTVKESDVAAILANLRHALEALQK
jgi:aspartate aminotransferase